MRDSTLRSYGRRLWNVASVFLVMLLWQGQETGVFAASPNKVTTVFVVRHAEKSDSPPQDPHLSETGQARARLLSDTLGSTGIKAIYTSQFIRTQETAQPLATLLHLPIEKVDATEIDKLVKDVLLKQSGAKVLIVGHSDTIPTIIKRLGGIQMPTVSEDKFDNLFIVTIYKAQKAEVVNLRYGTTTPH